MAYAFFAGLLSSSEELLDTMGSTDDVVPEDDFGDNPHPQHMATLQIQNLQMEMAAPTSATRAREVATQAAARHADAKE